MNKGLLIALAVIGVVLLIGASIAGWGISVYNKIVLVRSGSACRMESSPKSISTPVRFNSESCGNGKRIC